VYAGIFLARVLFSGRPLDKRIFLVSAIAAYNAITDPVCVRSGSLAVELAIMANRNSGAVVRP
jgi:hypothetical protein